jgi:D-3-phosphoglycerate dehydrogenase
MQQGLSPVIGESEEKTMTGNKKKIGIQLPRQANPEEIAIRYSLELEALEPVAEIIEVAAKTPEEFAAGVKHMDAIITSWGFRIDAQLIEQLENCVVIGVGSVGVDMVDIEAATRAGIVVTNVPDVFIEEVADHAMMMLLGCARPNENHESNGGPRRLVVRAPPVKSHPSADGPDLGTVRLRQCSPLHSAPGQGLWHARHRL